MLTKTGIHFHLEAGPPLVHDYEQMPVMRGPYYDIIIDDLDSAFDKTIRLIESHVPPGFMDEHEEDALMHMQEAYEVALYDDEVNGAQFSIAAGGFEFKFRVCKFCIPVGSN